MSHCDSGGINVNMKKSLLIFEKSVPGRKAYSLPPCDIPFRKTDKMIPPDMLRVTPADLPEVSEVDVVRHYTHLSKRNYGVDEGFYPLGSCTMKYNPKVNENIARFSGFQDVHPLQPIELSQGCLELMYELDKMLSEITGMDRVSLQPAAGAHGEMTGLMMIKAYHEAHGDTGRNKIIVPDSAHGTNPASAAVVGFNVVEVRSDSRGNVDIEALKTLMDRNVAGLMLTNPSTLGLFEENILQISDIVHNAGGLLYYDGANMNAVMGIARPGDMGFDVVHINLHKSFGTPHGGGGPGAGPVGVKEKLVPYLPVPMVEYQDNLYYLDEQRPQSVGRIKSFYGNFGVLVKAWSYILSMGRDGLNEASEAAIVNANYMMHQLRDSYILPYNRTCMHEFVLSCLKQKHHGVATVDIAKRLLDFGFHPPTMNFPLIVPEAIMIEPTETENRETLDQFIKAMLEIAKEAETEPEKVKGAPYHTVVSRIDEVGAARKPVLKWQGEE